MKQRGFDDTRLSQSWIKYRLSLFSIFFSLFKFLNKAYYTNVSSLYRFDFKIKQSFGTHIYERAVCYLKMAGRKYKITETSSKHFTNDEKEERLENEKVLYTFEPLNFQDVPTTLDLDGKKEWLRLSKILENIPISELDRAIITSYCYHVSLLERIRTELTNQPLTTDQGKANPLLSSMTQANKELKSLASELGLTIDSRMRIKNPTQDADPSDPFSAMLKGVDDDG